MTEANIKSMVLDGYESRQLPLHVLVLDMEWYGALPSLSAGNP
jgi:hypothetical protein